MIVLRPRTVLARRASSARSFPRDGRPRGVPSLAVRDLRRSGVCLASSSCTPLSVHHRSGDGSRRCAIPHRRVPAGVRSRRTSDRPRTTHRSLASWTMWNPSPLSSVGARCATYTSRRWEPKPFNAHSSCAARTPSVPIRESVPRLRPRRSSPVLSSAVSPPCRVSRRTGRQTVFVTQLLHPERNRRGCLRSTLAGSHSAVARRRSTLFSMPGSADGLKSKPVRSSISSTDVRNRACR